MSEINSPEFFLSPVGATNPSAELEATLAALYEPEGSKPDNHAQCRFIARYHWLLSALEWETVKPPQPVHCEEFNKFSLNKQVESLSLIFATGYLSNPASFYGHILLKFNTNRSIASNELLDQSVNFGALIPDGENGLVYVVKGLFGGYRASFSHKQFFNFSHMYAENDLRDMWEYELALSKDQVDQIVYHVWELLGKDFVYYFLDENCAYRMAQLLNLVIEDPLLPDLPWSIPATVFEYLDRATLHNKPVVANVRWIPSRQNRFIDKYSSLTEEGESVVKRLVEKDLDFSDGFYTSLAEPEKIAVDDTLIDYYEYLIIGDRKDKNLLRAKQKILIERSGLSADSTPAELSSEFPESVAPPHKSVLPFMLRAGWLNNNELGHGFELRIRPANYDTLSLDTGRIANSTLIMIDLTAAYIDDKLILRNLDFINIENLNISKTALPGEGGIAWKIKASVHENSLACIDCYVVDVTGGVGKATTVFGDTVVFGMLDMFAQSTYEDSGTLGIIPRVGLIAFPLPRWKTYISIGNKSYVNGSKSSDPVVRWENRLGNNRNWDIRFGYERDIGKEISTAVSFYW